MLDCISVVVYFLFPLEDNSYQNHGVSEIKRSVVERAHLRLHLVQFARQTLATDVRLPEILRVWSECQTPIPRVCSCL